MRTVETRVKPRHLDDPFLQVLKDVVLSNDEYQTVLNHLQEGTTLQNLKKLLTKSHVHSYLGVWDRFGMMNDTHGSLMTCDHNCLVVPKRLRG